MFDMPHLGVECFTKLSNVAVLNPSLDEKPAPDEVVSFVPMAALSAETASVVREAARPYAEVAKGYTAFQSGDLLVAKITPCFENNKIGFASISRHLGFGSTEFHVIRPNAESLDTRYLLHFLRQDHVRAEGERRMTGSAGQRRVPENFLANLMVPVPSIAEQRRIAAILDQADALRAKRRAALARLDEMGRAIFVEMFGGPATSNRWPTVQLREMLSIPLRNGVSPSSEGTIPLDVLTLSAVTGTAFDSSARKLGLFQNQVPTDKRVSALDLLICRGNGNLDLVGRGFLPTTDLSDVAFPDTMIAARVSPEAMVPQFLETVWNAPFVREQIKTRARTTNGTFKVNQQALEEMRLPAPPMALQQSFASRSAAVLKSSRLGRRHLSHLDALFTSFQHRAFRGEL